MKSIGCLLIWYKKMKKSVDYLFKNWNFVRLLRLVIGIFPFAEASKSEIWILVAVGAVFVLMPLLNMRCCITANYSVQLVIQKNRNDEVQLQEIR